MKKLFVVLVMLVAMNANGQWQPDVRLTNDYGTSYTSNNNAWCIASSGSVLHVVWEEYRNGNGGEIYYKRSTDAGVSWGTDTRLTNDTSKSWAPSVAVSGSVVHVVWQDLRGGNMEIFYKRSTDAGVSWGTDTRLTNDTSLSEIPSVTVSGSNVHVVWEDYRDGNGGEIYYKRSTDAGITWGTNIRLTNNASASWYPSIAVSGSVVHVVWQEYRDGNNEIYYKRSTDSGVSWGTDTRLTNNTAGSYNPSVAVSGSIVQVVWYDNRDGMYYKIFNKRSTDSGVSWGIDTRLTFSTGDSESPSVAVSGSVVHIVWQDYRDGNMEIYYKRSTDAGLTWEADTRLTANFHYSESPSVAVSGTVVQVVWADQRDGNSEIYYKRNPTGNVGIQNISTEVPSSYSLSQNYPNPFNPTTKIKFSVPQVRHLFGGSSPRGLGGDLVLLKIYDVMGREVQTLVNEVLQPGTYETTFDGSMLPSGVCFYKLTAGDFTETKRLTLLK
jgi:hypothetical protein